MDLSKASNRVRLLTKLQSKRHPPQSHSNTLERQGAFSLSKGLTKQILIAFLSAFLRDEA